MEAENDTGGAFCVRKRSRTVRCFKLGERKLVRSSIRARKSLVVLAVNDVDPNQSTRR